MASGYNRGAAQASSSRNGSNGSKANPLFQVVRLENGAFRVPGILSYPYLFSPQQSKQGEPKYSANLIIDKGVDLSVLEDGVEEAKRAKWGDRVPARLKEPIRDGDEYADKDGYGPGVVFIAARNERKPFVVDKNRQDIDDKEEIYPGAKVLMVVRPFGYDNESRGVSFSLQGVIKISEGDRLGSAPMTADDAMGDLGAGDFPDDDEIPF